jgi:hypothetical protein
MNLTSAHPPPGHEHPPGPCGLSAQEWHGFLTFILLREYQLPTPQACLFWCYLGLWGFRHSLRRSDVRLPHRRRRRVGSIGRRFGSVAPGKAPRRGD